ncbi:hypothetical protein L5515_018580 [Caenorhabditis briggsae]|uniref:DUF7154 domain-containing protein n=2 Tax=Caenorhabditis briggsae TaxID=6238 RepID=A0AAE9FJS8_CAEBR|nr:hypothetical protein L5515_018580 [Caenorhabditis briggsae]
MIVNNFPQKLFENRQQFQNAEQLRVIGVTDELFNQFIKHWINDATSCSPTTEPQTFLFAYSNDFSSKTVLDTWKIFSTSPTFNSFYGSVRFDTDNLDIQFHTNIRNVNSTIAKNLPNSNQGFQNSSIGSNVFDAIEKFFSNTQAPVCGSIILILLKRYPNEADSSRLVSIIRSHHAIVHVITSSTPSGGSQSEAMYSVTTKTNGMGAFEPDENFWDAIGWFPISGTLYPVYATTIQVSGKGKKTLPDFYPSITGAYLIALTYQDHVPDNSFRNFNLHFVNPGDSGNFKGYQDGSSDLWDDGNYIAQSFWFLNLDYKMTLNYNYMGQDVQNLQIRIYSPFATNNWLPYND